MLTLCDVVSLEMGFLRDETTAERAMGTEAALSEAGSGGCLGFTLRMLYPAVNAQRGWDYNTSLSHLPDNTKQLCAHKNQPLKSRHLTTEELGQGPLP